MMRRCPGELVSGGFVLSFNTVSGKTYTIEYKDLLTDPVWQTLQTVSGDGALNFVTNNTASPAQPIEKKVTSVTVKPMAPNGRRRLFVNFYYRAKFRLEVTIDGHPGPFTQILIY